DAAVALVGGAADRARLDQRLARPARTVRGRDATEVGVRTALALARLAKPRAATAIAVAAARRVGGVASAAGAPPGVIDARAAGARVGHGEGAAPAAAGAVGAVVRPARAAHRHEIA